MRRCAVEDCSRRHHARGLCRMHYGRGWWERNRERLLAQQRTRYNATRPNAHPNPRFAPILAADVDEVAVLRLMAGDAPEGFTSFERREAVRRLVVVDKTPKKLAARRLQVHERQVYRDLEWLSRVLAMDNGEVA